MAQQSLTDRIERALRAFNAADFCRRHSGYKESLSPRSFEYLLQHRGSRPDGQWCGSERLRWRHQPGVKYTWICWGCGKTGDTVDLIALFEKTDRAGAITTIIDGYVGGDAPTSLIETASMAPPARMLDRLPVIPMPPGYETIDPRASVHREATAYLIEQRGLTMKDIEVYRIGYARTGRLARYVIFPCFMDGGLVYWQGRATWDPPRGLSKDQLRDWKRATKYRKTLNPWSGDDEQEQVTTGSMQVLFNYDLARVQEHVVIVEGPIDAVKVGPHAVALFGKVPSPDKVERLLRMRARRYTVYLDPGEQERAKALELAAQLASFAPTFLATPPPGADPGNLTPEQNAWFISRAQPYKAVSGLRSNLRVS